MMLHSSPMHQFLAGMGLSPGGAGGPRSPGMPPGGMPPGGPPPAGGMPGGGMGGLPPWLAQILAGMGGQGGPPVGGPPPGYGGMMGGMPGGQMGQGAPAGPGGAPGGNPLMALFQQAMAGQAPQGQPPPFSAEGFQPSGQVDIAPLLGGWGSSVPTYPALDNLLPWLGPDAAAGGVADKDDRDDDRKGGGGGGGGDPYWNPGTFSSVMGAGR